MRKQLLKFVDGEAIVMETHGGLGKVYEAVYSDISSGVVFEKNAVKAEVLARQRPTWAVYETDCVNAIRGGAGRHLTVNFLDLDPYGEPWHVLDAFLESDREFPERLIIAVNDGMRAGTKISGGGRTKSLREACETFGNNLYPVYLEVAEWMMKRKAEAVGFNLARFGGYYCGHKDCMTHYGAVLEKR